MTNFIKGIIGEDAYINTKLILNKANRIYQRASNVAYTVISFVDIVKELSEIAVENTGKIGNALRKSGAVLENSYNIMPERATVQTATQAKIQSLSQNLQDATQALSTFTEVTELAVEGQENLRELRESKTALELSLGGQKDQLEQEREQLKQQSRSTVDITSIDFVKRPPEG